MHTRAHLATVAETAGRTVHFDADTQAGPRSYAAALRAAGAAVDATERVLKGELARAFCLVRPPGHHAETDQAMGFCLFNNVAVAAAHALARGAQRVLVVDFDVHHGNGTQEIFEEDPRVLYVSSHLFPFYPGTGSLSETGRGAGRGFTVNLPMPAGMGDAEYLRVYREIVEPIGKAFAPDLVLVSAGFDAYEGDPLANMALTAKGYAALAQTCVTIAEASAKGRAVFVLEGGYDLDGLAACGAAVTGVLLGDPAPEVTAACAPMDRLVEAYRTTFAEFWPVVTTRPPSGP